MRCIKVIKSKIKTLIIKYFSSYKYIYIYAWTLTWHGTHINSILKQIFSVHKFTIKLAKYIATAAIKKYNIYEKVNDHAER